MIQIELKKKKYIYVNLEQSVLVCQCKFNKVVLLSHASSFFSFSCVCAKLLLLCPTLGDCMDCSPPDSSVHGSPQARILEWVAISSCKGSSEPRD